MSPETTSATVTALRAIRPEGIPPEKWTGKMVRVVVGAGFIVGGILFKTQFGAPWWVAAIGCGLGAHIWAGEVINRTLLTLPKLVAGAIADILGAITRGKSGP